MLMSPDSHMFPLEEEPIILHVTPPAVSQADQICQYTKISKTNNLSNIYNPNTLLCVCV